MSDRQYGIPLGYRQGSPVKRPSPPSSSPERPPQGRYRPSEQHSYWHSPEQARVPPSATAAVPPPPPPHRQDPQLRSPPLYQPDPFSTPRRRNPDMSQAHGGFAAPAPDFDEDSDPFGMSTLRDIDNLYGSRMVISPSHEPEDRPFGAPRAAYAISPLPRAQRPYSPERQQPPFAYGGGPASYATPERPAHYSRNSQSSVAPLMASRPSPERHTPSPQRGQFVEPAAMPRGYSYREDGYEDFDPREIADDGEDSVMGSPRARREGRFGSAGVVGAGVGVAGGGMLRSFSTRDRSGAYGRVPGGGGGRDAEKSTWLEEQKSGGKKVKIIVGSIIALIVIAAIVGGAVGGVLASQSSSGKNNEDSSSSAVHSGSSSSSDGKDGLYDIDSKQVKALLHNDALHKVFPGMDYTPFNAQYPDCLSNPPDQNNITLDIAILSQLTPAVRLYGTDCNQTEMVLTAIDRLGYNSTLQLWLGVWLGNNATTNTRQLQQMYHILDNYPSTHFAGIIVGNEVLFREDLTETELGTQLTAVRQNLTARGISDLPIATSDLGDDWTKALAADTDIVMANVHPFFAGVTPEEAPGWTWKFWQTHDVVLTSAAESSRAGYPRHIISEVGWPSEGGNNCGTEDGCSNATAGAVASIANMNTFMDGWVCQALANGTSYFWFEAFDEPWKTIFDTKTDKWESKWGLMDPGRKVKDGLKIPDCGGKTVDKAY